jgi:hypothetical protein
MTMMLLLGQELLPPQKAAPVGLMAALQAEKQHRLLLPKSKDHNAIHNKRYFTDTVSSDSNNYTNTKQRFRKANCFTTTVTKAFS